MNQLAIDKPRYAPRITVAAVVEHHNRYLLVEEWVNDERVFNQPAGHLESTETLLQAVVRETWEESGCVIEPMHLISIYHSDIDQPNKSKLRFNFAAHAVLDSGIIKADWLSLESLQQKPLRSAMVLQCIQDYLTGQQLPLSSITNSCGAF